MKRNRFVFGAFIILVLCIIGATTKHYSAIGPFRSSTFVSVSLTGNVTGAALPVSFVGGRLYSVEIKCTDDDAITYTIYGHRGSTLATASTTAAIAGDMDVLSTSPPVNGPMTYTIAGYGDSSGCTMEVTLWGE